MKFKKQSLSIEKLEELRDEISQLIDDREFFFDERSEKWQESEKGEEFQTVQIAVILLMEQTPLILF